MFKKRGETVEGSGQVVSAEKCETRMKQEGAEGGETEDRGIKTLKWKRMWRVWR